MLIVKVYALEVVLQLGSLTGNLTAGNAYNVVTFSGGLHCLSAVLLVFILFYDGQEQVEEMKKKEERLEKQMAEVTAENKKLTDPLQKANNEVDELRRQLANYDKDKQLLAVSRQCDWQVVDVGWCQSSILTAMSLCLVPFSNVLLMFSIDTET